MSEQQITSGTNAAVPLTLADLNSVEFTPDEEALMAEALRRAIQPLPVRPKSEGRRSRKRVRGSVPQ